MTEHLPECPCPSTADDEHEPGCGATGLAAPSIRCCKGWPPNNCICDRLRACEERVTRAVMHTVDADSYEQGERDCKATHPVLALKEITRIASKGYDAGLNAAREAVAAIHDDCNCYEDLGIRTEAIAVIDALREKP